MVVVTVVLAVVVVVVAVSAVWRCLYNNMYMCAQGEAIVGWGPPLAGMSGMEFGIHTCAGTMYAFRGDLRYTYTHGVFRKHNYCVDAEDCSLDRWTVVVRMGITPVAQHYLFLCVWRHNDGSAKAVDVHLAACAYAIRQMVAQKEENGNLAGANKHLAVLFTIASIATRWETLQRTNAELGECLKTKGCMFEHCHEHCAMCAFALCVGEWSVSGEWVHPRNQDDTAPYLAWLFTCAGACDTAQKGLPSMDEDAFAKGEDITHAAMEVAVMAHVLSPDRYRKNMSTLLAIAKRNGAMGTGNTVLSAFRVAKMRFVARAAMCYTLWGTRAAEKQEGELPPDPSTVETLQLLKAKMCTWLRTCLNGPALNQHTRTCCELLCAVSMLSKELGVPDVTKTMPTAVLLSQRLAEGDLWPCHVHTLEDIWTTVYMAMYLAQR